MEEMNRHQIEILEAGSLEAGTIKRFFENCVTDYPYMGGVLRHGEWPAKLAGKADCICVRSREGELLGALFCYCNDAQNGRAYIPFVSVLSSCMSQCHGRDLHSEFVRHARSRGMNVCSLEVDKPNVTAYEFYIRLGYHVVEDHGDKYLLSLDLL